MANLGSGMSLEEDRKRNRSRGTLNRAIKNGDLLRPSCCQQCGVTADAGATIHAHHEDYDQPLGVIWLCQDCHGQRHGMKRLYPFRTDT